MQEKICRQVFINIGDRMRLLQRFAEGGGVTRSSLIAQELRDLLPKLADSKVRESVRSLPVSNDTTQITVYLPADLNNELSARSKECGLHQSAVILTAIARILIKEPMLHSSAS